MSTTRHPFARPARRRVALETLEPRRLFAATLADFAGDFPGPTSSVVKPGWAYLWNAPVGWSVSSPGALGSAPASDLGAFAPLARVSGAHAFTPEGELDGNAADAYPAGEAAIFRDATGVVQVTPGLARSDPGGNSVERFVAAAYTLQPGQAGFVSLTAGSLGASGAIPGNTEIRVQVRRAGVAESAQPQPATVDFTHSDPGAAGAPRETIEFQSFLGYLTPGDTVYVMVGPDNQALNDTSALSFRLQTDAAPGGLIPVSTHTQTIRARSAGGMARPRVPSGEAPAPGDESLMSSPAADAVEDGVVVPRSGYYALHDATAQPPTGAVGAATLSVWIDEESAPRKTFALAAAADFSLDLGYLSAGQRVRVTIADAASARRSPDAESSGGLESQVGYVLAEWAPRRAPLRVLRAADGYLQVFEPAAPLVPVSVPPQRWIDVGADNGDGDYAAEIRAAIAAAVASRGGNSGLYVGVRLNPAVVYRVGNGVASGDEVFEYTTSTNVNRLIFDGRGASFLVTNRNAGLFRFDGHSNVVLADFTVDYSNLAFTQGNIDSVTYSGADATVVFTLDEGFPDPIADLGDGPGVKVNGLAYSPTVQGRMADGTWPNYPGSFPGNLTRVGGAGSRRFSHVVTRHDRSIPVGAKWILKNRETNLIWTIDGQDFTVSGLRVHASSGGFFRFFNTSGANVLDTQVTVPDGRRWLATTADAVYGYGRESAWVENSRFNAISEDMFNFRTAQMVVTASRKSAGVRYITLGKLTDNGASTNKVDDGDVRAGDRLSLFDSLTGETLFSVTVVAINYGSGEATLDRDPPGVDWSALRWSEGDGLTAAAVYNPSAVSNFVLRDSELSNGLRYGMFLKASGGLIFHNRFSGFPGNAIVVTNEPEWPEGPLASRIWIQDNDFEDNNFGYQSLHRRQITVDPADISVYTRRLGSGADWRAYVVDAQVVNDPVARIHEIRDVRIIGNRFSGWRGMGIAARNTRNLEIRDNLFAGLAAPGALDVALRQTLDADPLLANPSSSAGYYSAIYLDTVDGARLSGNVAVGLTGGDRLLTVDADVVPLHLWTSGWPSESVDLAGLGVRTASFPRPSAWRAFSDRRVWAEEPLAAVDAPDDLLPPTASAARRPR